MSTWKKGTRPRAFRSFSTDPGRWRCGLRRLAGLGLLLVATWCGGDAFAGPTTAEVRTFPVEMDGLLRALGDARTPSPAGEFPRVVAYPYTEWNMLEGTLKHSTREMRIVQKPRRIIPHSVGLTEILWAIAPRAHIAAIHRSNLNPEYSFIAGAAADFPVTYASEDAEVVIGLRPDLILTAYYSSEEFKNRLRLSAVPFVEVGYFGDMASIQEQVETLGSILGEEAAARRLVTTMQENIAAIQEFARRQSGGKQLRVVYYGLHGYVAGESSTFDSLCALLGVVNIPAAEGVRFFKQVDYETLLKWDPDVIVVPAGSGLEEELRSHRILRTAKAVRGEKIRSIPNVYLMASSQFAVASLNYLGGLFYGE
jgi:iron complex transport system substrate-binding protein